MTVHLLYVCTGNATRSFLAEAYTRARRPDWQVESAGTLVIPGTVTSRRTRAAFEAIALEVPPHTSRQLEEAMLARADLVLGFEPMHLDYVRRVHPQYLDRMMLLDHPDPEGGDEAVFRDTALAIRASIDSLLRTWEQAPPGPVHPPR